MSEKTIAMIHGTLHAAIKQAVKDGIIKNNVCDSVKPPKTNEPKEEMHPLKDEQVGLFLRAIQGNPYAQLFYIALFTGMRESELIGLTWDCIDFEQKTIRIYRQLSREEIKGGKYIFTKLKNKRERTFSSPDSVMDALRKVKRQQAEWRLQCGECWQETNLVFTQEDGRHIFARTVYNNFKKIVKGIGLPEVRFHDLRHTYATLALQNGVNIKTVSTSLGHATVAFTMDKYAHVSQAMMRSGAEIMQRFIESL